MEYYIIMIWACRSCKDQILVNGKGTVRKIEDKLNYKRGKNYEGFTLIWSKKILKKKKNYRRTLKAIKRVTLTFGGLFQVFKGQGND